MGEETEMHGVATICQAHFKSLFAVIFHALLSNQCIDTMANVGSYLVLQFIRMRWSKRLWLVPMTHTLWLAFFSYVNI